MDCCWRIESEMIKEKQIKWIFDGNNAIGIGVPVKLIGIMKENRIVMSLLVVIISCY